jgi:hypothetical protein
MPTKSFDIRLPIRGDLFVPLRGYPLVRYIYHIILSANCKQNLIYISIQLLGKNQAMIRGFWGDKIGYIRYIKTRYRALIWGDIGRNREAQGIASGYPINATWGLFGDIRWGAKIGLLIYISVGDIGRKKKS